MKPPFSWVGGKRHWIDIVMSLLQGRDFRQLYSPFLGAGALELEILEHTPCDRAFLSDGNAQLMRQWEAIADMPAVVNIAIEALELRSDFYLTRQELNEGAPGSELAHLAWLVPHAFSALPRWNTAGQYNAPEDKTGGRYVATGDHLEEISELFRRRRATLLCRPWDGPLPIPTAIGERDLVILDPPYVGTFSGYGSGGWTEADLDALLVEARRMADAGAMVLLFEGAGQRERVEAALKPGRILEKARNASVNGKYSAGCRLEICAIVGGE